MDGGLVIHEGQLTYGRGGLHNVLDLGRWFKQKFDLPCRWAAMHCARGLAPDVQDECCKLMRESIQYALDHSGRGAELRHAVCSRPGRLPLAEQFVGMYVNRHTLDGGEIVPRAAQKLLDLGFEAGIIPSKITVEVRPSTTTPVRPALYAEHI